MWKCGWLCCNINVGVVPQLWTLDVAKTKITICLLRSLCALFHIKARSAACLFPFPAFTHMYFSQVKCSISVNRDPMKE